MDGPGAGRRPRPFRHRRVLGWPQGGARLRSRPAGDDGLRPRAASRRFCTHARGACWPGPGGDPRDRNWPQHHSCSAPRDDRRELPRGREAARGAGADHPLRRIVAREPRTPAAALRKRRLLPDQLLARLPLPSWSSACFRTWPNRSVYRARSSTPPSPASRRLPAPVSKNSPLRSHATTTASPSAWAARKTSAPSRSSPSPASPGSTRRSGLCCW